VVQKERNVNEVNVCEHEESESKRSDSRSIAPLGLTTQFIGLLNKCNHSKLASVKFLFVLILARTIVAL